MSDTPNAFEILDAILMYPDVRAHIASKYPKLVEQMFEVLRAEKLHDAAEVNTLKKAIADIEALYPIDSGFETTNAIGEELLAESVYDFGWRKLPSELLKIYAAKCRARVGIEETVK